MPVNYYQIAGVTLRIESEKPIQKSGMLFKFSCEKTKSDIDVRIILTEKLPKPDGKPIFRSERQCVFEKDSVRYTYCSYFDAAKKEYVYYSCLAEEKDGFRLYIRFENNKVWDTMVLDALDFPNILLSFDAAIMHCSFVIKNGKAILFTADKQVGKSTQANLWKKYAGAKIINGDRAAIKIKNGVLYACGVPFCGSSDISENEEAPIAAIVELSQGQKNVLSVLPPASAFRCILGKLSYQIKDRDKAEKAADIAAFASKTKVYHLSCLPDEGAVRLLEEELWKS